MPENTSTQVRIPPAIYTAIQLQLAVAAKMRQKADAADFAAQAILKEYCDALGFPRDSRYEYRPHDHAVVILPPPQPNQPIDGTQEA